jgi:hypothetical protein
MTYKVKMRIAKPLLAFQTQTSAIFIQFKLNAKQPADCFILLKPPSPRLELRTLTGYNT